MMSVSTLFIGLDVVSCILICLVTLGIVLGLVDFHFLLSNFIRVINIIKLIRATISVFFVPCCPVLLSFYLVLSYMFELNKWRYWVILDTTWSHTSYTDVSVLNCYPPSLLIITGVENYT